MAWAWSACQQHEQQLWNSRSLWKLQSLYYHSGSWLPILHFGSCSAALYSRKIPLLTVAAFAAIDRCDCPDSIVRCSGALQGTAQSTSYNLQVAALSLGLPLQVNGT